MDDVYKSSNIEFKIESDFEYDNPTSKRLYHSPVITIVGKNNELKGQLFNKLCDRCISTKNNTKIGYTDSKSSLFPHFIFVDKPAPADESNFNGYVEYTCDISLYVLDTEPDDEDMDAIRTLKSADIGVIIISDNLLSDNLKNDISVIGISHIEEILRMMREMCEKHYFNDLLITSPVATLLDIVDTDKVLILLSNGYLEINQPIYFKNQNEIKEFKIKNIYDIEKQQCNTISSCNLAFLDIELNDFIPTIESDIEFKFKNTKRIVLFSPHTNCVKTVETFLRCDISGFGVGDINANKLKQLDLAPGSTVLVLHSKVEESAEIYMKENNIKCVAGGNIFDLKMKYDKSMIA
jgi:hypothetical protein